MSNYTQNPQVKVVASFQELSETPYSDQKNAICWERKLEGDFNEIVDKLNLDEDITIITTDDLMELQLSTQGDLARKIILSDIENLSNIGAQPTLNLLKAYERDDVFDFISTDVYSYHVDRSPVPTHTFLCTYFGAASDIIRNEDVVQKIQIAAVREQLKKYHSPEDGTFEEFLAENFFDLHYQANEDAKPTNLGIGNLWRLAVDHPQQTVEPCVHRAPKENPGEYRLLLIC